MFGQSSRKWHLFTLNGHRVYMEPWFLGLIGLFVFWQLNSAAQLGQQLLWAPILFFGVLGHEFGHAIAIKYFGYGNSVIVLQGFGGVTINQTRARSTPGQAIVISVAGPIASALMGFASLLGYYFYPGASNSLLSDFFIFNAYVNFFWAVFNMLPINPMDGGHVVLHALRKFMNPKKAMLYSAYSSLAALGLLVLFATAIGWFNIILIVIVMMFGMQNFQVIQAIKKGYY